MAALQDAEVAGQQPFGFTNYPCDGGVCLLTGAITQGKHEACSLIDDYLVMGGNRTTGYAVFVLLEDGNKLVDYITNNPNAKFQVLYDATAICDGVQLRHGTFFMLAADSIPTNPSNGSRLFAAPCCGQCRRTRCCNDFRDS